MTKFYIEVTKSIFMDEFKSIRPDNFSYDGLSVLYDYLDEAASYCDEGLELDVIAICFYYSEYDAEDLINAYGYMIEDELADIEDEDEKAQCLLKHLEDYTPIIEIDKNSWIIQNF